MKEAIGILLSIFLGFVVLHAVMISYGVLAHVAIFQSHARPTEGQTLNAVVFRSIFAEWTLFGVDWAEYLLPFMLASAGGLLFVTANKGILEGPAVLADTAVDQWVLNQFSSFSSRGTGMHTMLWVQRLFPGNLKNFVFLSIGAVDTAAYGAEGAIETLHRETNALLEYYVNFFHEHGIAAMPDESCGTDRVEERTKLVDKVCNEYLNVEFFTSQLVFVHDS